MSNAIPTLEEASAVPGSHEVVVEMWVREPNSGAVLGYNSFRVLVDPAEIRRVKWEESIVKTGAELRIPFTRADISGWVDGKWTIVATWSLERGLTWL